MALSSGWWVKMLLVAGGLLLLLSEHRHKTIQLTLELGITSEEVVSACPLFSGGLKVTPTLQLFQDPLACELSLRGRSSLSPGDGICVAVSQCPSPSMHAISLSIGEIVRYINQEAHLSHLPALPGKHFDFATAHVLQALAHSQWQWH